MPSRAEQRAETRARIVEAAVACFADLGFRGASTREIARRAGTNQGLITYHFSSKDALWRAAADRVIQRLRERLGDRLAALESDDPRARARESIREYVRFAAGHPELFRLMVDEGNTDDERTQWLVETHLKPMYDALPAVDSDPARKAHLFYAMAGAASVIFAVAPECRRLTGVDPTSEEAIEAHAELVAGLLVP